MRRGERDGQLLPLPPDLVAPPDPFPSLPIATQPGTLPCRELTWRNFERLCVEVARLVDATTDCRLYGRSGQKQHRIDVYARLLTGDHVVYQVRDIARLTATKLRKAVGDYVGGRRPLDAARFVLCVACRVEDTRVDDEFRRLRDAHATLELDLYDEERLSALLRAQPYIVERFFGSYWREAFCDPEPASRSKAGTDTGRLADELLRGPIRSLGLAPQLAEVEHAEPDRAAELYDLVAARLDERGFALHAVDMRRRLARALEDAGRLRDAFDCWFDLARQEVEGGSAYPMPPDLRSAGELLSRLDHGGDERGQYAALDGFAGWYVDPAPDFSLLRSGAKALLERHDPLAPRACMWLAEAAVVDERWDLVLDMAAELRTVASEQADEGVAVRLRLALADADGDWVALVREASTGRLEPGLAALVHARYGRCLAWQADPASAEDSLRRAIEIATRAEVPGDVAEALVSVTVVRERYGPFDDETLDPHRLAGAIEGTRTLLRGRRDALRSALRSWRGGDKPATHRALRRYLWECRLSGHFASQLEAHRLLGELYAEASEPHWAIWHLIRAGRAKEAADIASSLAQPFDVTDAFVSPAPWIAAATLAVVAAEADLLSDEQVAALVPLLLRASAGVRQGPFGPQVSFEAMKALAAFGDRLPHEWVGKVLAIFEPLVARESGRHHLSDEAMLATFVGLYRAHPTWRDTIAGLLARCLTDDGLAYQALKLMHDLGEAPGSLILALRPLAADGNRWALELLARFGDDEPALLPEAERRVTQVLALETKNGANEWSLLAVDTAASVFARHLPEERQVALARQWLRLAQDSADIAANRASALEGLSILAGDLPPTVRAELFEPVLALLQPPDALSEVDAISASTLHPLNPFQINLSPDSLPQAAMRTVAALAVGEGQARRVEQAILQAIRSGNEGAVHAAAVALVRLAPQFVTLDLRPLAVHASPWVRQAAAVLWARRASELPEIGVALARDTDRGVRAVIAAQLAPVTEIAPSVSIVLREILTRDRSATVRRIAARGES